MHLVTRVMDAAPRLMLTLLCSSCSGDCAMPPGCGEADRDCEGDETDDNVSVLQSQRWVICHLMIGHSLSFIYLEF